MQKYYRNIDTNQIHNSVIQYCLTTSEALKNTHTSYLLTTRLKPLTSKHYNNERYCDYAFSNFNKIYMRLCSSLVKNFTRPTKQHLLPVSFDFIDDTASKCSRIRTLSSTPHLHSIFHVRFEHQKQFDSLMNAAFIPIIASSSELRFIESVHAKPITSNLYHAISYASKLLTHPIARNATLFDMNPRINQSSRKTTSINLSHIEVSSLA